MSITNLSLFTPESEIDPAVARDIEYQAADRAHVDALDPHPQYLNPSRGDIRYQSLLPLTIVQQHVSAPARISINANTWFSLGDLPNLNSGSSESLFAMSLYIQYTDSSGNTNPWWQNAGACLISPIWWKASGGQLVKYIDMESHAKIDYTMSFRLSLAGQGSRAIELFFPIALTARLIRATFIRFF